MNQTGGAPHAGAAHAGAASRAGAAHAGAPHAATRAPGGGARADWIGDAWGGLAAALVALPSAIAFGVAILAPLGAEFASRGALAGVIGAIVLGLVNAPAGGTPRLISAPCAPAAAVMGALAASLVTTRAPAEALAMLVLVALLSGGLQLGYGALGGGKFIKYIPFPVVSGYLSGVAILIVLKQTPGLLGLPAGMKLGEGLASPGRWQAPSLIVGATTMAGMALAPRLTKAVPPPIVGLAAGVLAYFGFGALRPALLDPANPLVIGPVGAGGASLLSGVAEQAAALGRLAPADVVAALVPALTLSALLSIDTLKTCVIVDAVTRGRHDSNRELRGQGLGNLLSALGGGVPGAGTMGATLVNLHAGARTRRSGVIEGLVCLAALVAFGGLIGWIPIAALSGILLVVAYKMFDRRTLRLARSRATLLDFVVIVVVIAVAVGVGLIAAAGAGLALAAALFVREQMRGAVVRRRCHGNEMFSKQRRLPEERAVLEERGRRTTICELQGNLFFGTTDRLLTDLGEDLRTQRFLILDLRRVQTVDFTAAHLLEQMESRLAERGGRLIYAGLPRSSPTGQELRAYFDELGLGEERGAMMLDGLDDALAWVEEAILAEARPEGGPEAVLDLARIDLLRELEPDTLATLAGDVEQRSFRAGETIFRHGDGGDELFLIRRGKVRIRLPLGEGQGHTLASFSRGDFFGEMAFLDRGGRSADAVAATDADLYVLSRRRFDAFSHAHAEHGARVFARLARALAIRLRHTDAELRALQEA